ncbi:protein FAM234A [Periophthalmus magnuspinnatus]|uniref:protein FAM234A n=1 Tax=Periophthalmus magnuspinnatus TaxID=409849 RepID=UPI00145BDCF9|nr:protein FAM234A [Periophthalmus magnuspinnatus]XP_033841200.1 protein FAM234A [Periophthalmus magnuspinnatus]
MENSDHPAEGDPLKREDGVEAGPPASTTELKKGCKELGFAKLTHWRTAVFFFSLFLCLTVVFAFSFIIPCPVRPQYLIAWNRTFNETATYDFLAVEYASKDKVMDVLFVIKSSDESQNITCADKGLPSPCIFLLAVDGTDGETLWKQPLEPEFHWAQCGLKKYSSRSWDCLVSHSDKLTAIDKSKGEVQWQQPQPAGQPSTIPVLSLPDLDSDKEGDVALLAHDSESTKVIFLSGKTGLQIGSTVQVNATKTVNHLLYRTKGGSYYILFEKDTGLFGLALWRVAAKAGIEAGLTKDKHWESKANAIGLVHIFKSEQVRQVLKTAEKDSANLLVVTDTEVLQIDGNLEILWMYNTSSILGIPSFGHFNKDEILDVVIEEGVGNNTKKVIILDGESGVVVWEVTLQASTNSPRPASIHTANSFSVFMFWGLVGTETNSSVEITSNRRAYMLHPLYSKVLLESPNAVDHIITFRATLLEHGRHAAYFTLTGPGSEGVEGTVILSKRKLKQDVPESRVIRIGSGGDTETNENIKEAFNRLRFSDE